MISTGVLCKLNSTMQTYDPRTGRADLYSSKLETVRRIFIQLRANTLRGPGGF